MPSYGLAAGGMARGPWTWSIEEEMGQTLIAVPCRAGSKAADTAQWARRRSSASSLRNLLWLRRWAYVVCSGLSVAKFLSPGCSPSGIISQGRCTCDL